MGFLKRIVLLKADLSITIDYKIISHTRITFMLIGVY